MTRKAPDPLAAKIEWGVELETAIPNTCGVAVGNYHGNTYVTGGRKADNASLAAPMFRGKYWRADRDGSITFDRNTQGPCEFVSPVIGGPGGLVNLVKFVQFAKDIGATVNPSCGCHITVGVCSVIGSEKRSDVAKFVRRLVRIVNQHAWAIYAQTGAGRHHIHYSAPLPPNTGDVTNDILKLPDAEFMKMTDSAVERCKLMMMNCGRGIVNLQKAFPSNASRAAVEFRAFAGTLNENKILHHLATVLGLVRRAATTALVPPFHGAKPKTPKDAPYALRHLWDYLGWLEDRPGAECAFGLFDQLYDRWPEYSAVAMEKAKKFEAKYPQARL
jgi:hypothetical protein